MSNDLYTLIVDSIENGITQSVKETIALLDEDELFELNAEVFECGAEYLMENGKGCDNPYNEIYEYLKGVDNGLQ